MSGFFNGFIEFFSVKLNRGLFFLAVITLIAFLDYIAGGYTRRTFLFYSAAEGKPVVEGRMLRHSNSRETDIRRYVEDALLGPVTPDTLPLFPWDAKLLSLMFRKGVVYAGFSDIEAIPWEEEAVFRGFLTLNEGLRRNFSSVKDVKFFVEGSEIYAADFSRKFADSADNFLNPLKKALTK